MGGAERGVNIAVVVFNHRLTEPTTRPCSKHLPPMPHKMVYSMCSPRGNDSMAEGHG